MVQAAPACETSSSTNSYPFERAFVVSLRHDRLAKFMSRLPYELRLCMTHVAATDGRNINLTEWQQRGLYNSTANQKLADDTAFAEVFPKPAATLTRGNLRSYSSHIRIWWAMLQQSIPAALICEDDAIISVEEQRKMFQVATELQATDLLSTYHIVYLGTNWLPDLKSVHGTSLSEPDIYGLWHVIHAYILTLEGAHILLSRSLPMLYPADVYIASQLRYGLRALQTNVSIINVDAAYGADTQGIL